MDSLGTGIMPSTGSYDAAKKSWTMIGSSANPVTGEDEKMKEVITVVNADKHTFEMFGFDGGKEELLMRITYTRAK
jgi:hypothetical protein